MVYVLSSLSALIVAVALVSSVAAHQPSMDACHPCGAQVVDCSTVVMCPNSDCSLPCSALTQEAPAELQTLHSGVVLYSPVQPSIPSTTLSLQKPPPRFA